MHLPDFIIFASDAMLCAMAGGALLLLAALALLGDRRRARRRHVDDVGIMPWTAIYLFSTMAGLILLALALTGWMAR